MSSASGRGVAWDVWQALFNSPPNLFESKENDIQDAKVKIILQLRVLQTDREFAFVERRLFTSVYRTLNQEERGEVEYDSEIERNNVEV